MATTFGKYIIEKKLGEGGMGVVYLAIDPVLSRKVALKVMTLQGEEAQERFLREARACAKLNHPNIIQVYEVGTLDNYHYFTMDYVEGQSLDNLIKTSHEKVTPRQVAEVIRQIASALDYAHSQYLLHRDIKPANILIDNSGRVYLTDFGLAKETSGLERSLTLSGSVIGTPDYMSPEQARGEKRKIDPRSDVFSLGATLYHALTAQTPFSAGGGPSGKGVGLYQVLEQVVNKDPIPPTTFIRTLPRDLETICLKCMEKEPAQRYQSARELADDLTRFLSGEVLLAKPVSRTTKLWRSAMKNKLASIGITSAVVILLTGIIALMVSSARTSQRLEVFRKDAFAHYKGGRYEEALITCEKIREITKNDEEINGLYKIVRLEIDRQQETQKEKEKRDKIRAEAMAMIENAKYSSVPDQKIESAKKALEIDPTFAEAYLLMGRGWKEKGDYEEAVRCFTQAIKLQSDFAYAYYERVLITAFIWNKQEEAISDFEMVLKYDPESNIGYYAKGNIEYNQQKYDEAIKSYNKAIELYPKDSWSYNNRGFTYADKGELEQAIADFSEAIRLDPKSVLAYYNRGLVYANKGELDRAIADFNEAIRFDPKDAEAYYSRGLAYYNKDELDRAIADYSEAIRLDANFVKAYTNRGSVYADKGELDRAIKDWIEAIRLDPKLANAYCNLGAAYVLLAEREYQQDGINSAPYRELINKAIANLERFLELLPKDPQGHPMGHPQAETVRKQIEELKKELK